MPSFKSNLDLQKHQLLNPVLHNLSTLPTTPVAGQMCFDTGKKLAYIWTGTDWVIMGDGPPPPQIKQFTYHVQTPAKGSGFVIARMYQNLTVLRVDSHLSAGTSVSFNLEYRSSVNAIGTSITSTPIVALTSGTQTGSFAYSMLPADNWLFLSVTDISGSVGLLSVTLSCTI
jgi:hypothetical protein